MVLGSPIHTTHYEWGFNLSTLAEDGDPLDVTIVYEAVAAQQQKNCPTSP